MKDARCTGRGGWSGIHPKSVSPIRKDNVMADKVKKVLAALPALATMPMKWRGRGNEGRPDLKVEVLGTVKANKSKDGKVTYSLDTSTLTDKDCTPEQAVSLCRARGLQFARVFADGFAEANRARVQDESNPVGMIARVLDSKFSWGKNDDERRQMAQIIWAFYVKMPKHKDMPDFDDSRMLAVLEMLEIVQ